MSKRSQFKRCAKQIADRLSARPYSFWSRMQEPWTFECMFEGQQLQVEVEVPEVTQEYVLVSVAVDDGGLWAYCPPGITFRVESSTAEPG